jgi:signal transduction histidine kinase
VFRVNPPDDTLERYRFIVDLGSRLKHARDETKSVLGALQASRDFLRATDASFAVLRPGAETATIVHASPKEAPWDPNVFRDFLTGRKLEHGPDTIFARLTRRGRWWGAIGLRRGEPFEKHDLQTLKLVAEAVSECLQRIDREDVHRVRARLDRKILQQLAPKDLYYQILDGIRSLTAYDHSCALLSYDEPSRRMTVVAEQLAGPSSKSPHIGLTLGATPDHARALARGKVLEFVRGQGGWETQEEEDRSLAELLDYRDESAAAQRLPHAAALLCAPLATRAGVLGVLKVASRYPRGLGPYEAELIGDFSFLVAAAIQNARHAEDLVNRMLDVERTNAVANVARYVSHDVNNHLGATLLAVQQLRQELEEGPVDRETLRADLAHIEQALQSTRRIFQGMTRFARTTSGHVGGGDFHRALSATLAVLGESLGRQGIEVSLDIEPGLPPLSARQGELEQILSNLVINAREAMPSGGRLRIEARRDGDFVEIVVADTGVGIPADQIDLVLEPFYTTKSRGTGLGLSSCRAIVWSLRGSIALESEAGKGTRVRIRLPLERGAQADA